MNEMNACMKMHGMNLSRQIIEKSSNKNMSFYSFWYLCLKIPAFLFDLRYKKEIAFRNSYALLFYMYGLIVNRE